VKVLEEVDAIMPQTHEMLPLGNVAASVRGVNELWLAVAFSESSLNKLNPAQLAAACASFVSEGVKIRTQTRTRFSLTRECSFTQQ
jgi:superfamily II RNA helicase